MAPAPRATGLNVSICMSYLYLWRVFLLAHIYTALLRQGNINWEAYFFVTDEQPFDDELRVMLQEYKDLRLRYLPIDMKFRGKV